MKRPLARTIGRPDRQSTGTSGALACKLDAAGFATERHLDQATKDAIETVGRHMALPTPMRGAR